MVSFTRNHHFHISTCTLWEPFWPLFAYLGVTLGRPGTPLDTFLVTLGLLRPNFGAHGCLWRSILLKCPSNNENDGFAYTKPSFSHFHLHPLGPLWEPFGPLFGHLGVTLGCLGTPLGCFLATLGTLWRPWGALGCFWKQIL